MPKNKTTDKVKVPFTIVLGRDDLDKLEQLAHKESRPRAQMARVLLERAIRDAKI